ncbi:hypothetical protein VUJ46_16300 [Chryseobacterium sp. MYb264]|uniref:hypothetical protein n=1 Tax=Chryseobacterium sp. MYb264 TaxID=2745153 RepID=UPI002E154055|nr:hypothetical protein VUJ46_16300 [Chryseobacterium sp. MYb264]
MLVRKFKKGVKDLFAQLEGILDEIFGFGEKMGDHALTPSEKRVKEKVEAREKRLNEKTSSKKKLGQKQKDYLSNLILDVNK